MEKKSNLEVDEIAFMASTPTNITLENQSKRICNLASTPTNITNPKQTDVCYGFLYLIAETLGQGYREKYRVISNFTTFIGWHLPSKLLFFFF